MMQFFSWLFGTPASNQYRVVRRLGGYEPQMSYTAGIAKGVFWYPLGPDGTWLEPDAFTHGKTTKHISLPKEDAKRAILRARAMNQPVVRRTPSIGAEPLKPRRGD